MKPTLEKKKTDHSKSKSQIFTRSESVTKLSTNNPKPQKSKMPENSHLRSNTNILNQKSSSENVAKYYFQNILNNEKPNNSYSAKFSKIQKGSRKNSEKQTTLSDNLENINERSQENQIDG